MFHFLYILNALQDSQYTIEPYRVLKQVLDFLVGITNPLGSIVALDCYRYYPPEETKDHFFMQVIVMILFPPAVVFLNFFLWYVLTKFTKCCKSGGCGSSVNLSRLLNRVSILVGMCLFIFYPSICEVLLQSVNCFPSLEQEGPFDTPVSRLRIYPSIVCTDHDYVIYSYVFRFFIFVYVVFIPGVALYYMCKNKWVASLIEVILF